MMPVVGSLFVVVSEELRGQKEQKLSRYLEASCSVIPKSTPLAGISQTSRWCAALNSNHFHDLFGSLDCGYLHPFNVLVWSGLTTPFSRRNRLKEGVFCVLTGPNLRFLYEASGDACSTCKE